MNYFTLLSVALLLFLRTRSEEVYYPELTNLFESDLVVDASYSRVDGSDYFLIRINEVLKGEQYGLSQGDYLRLKQLKHGGCGEPIYHSAYKRSRYYLKKTKRGWSIHYGTKQSIQPANQFAGIRARKDYHDKGRLVMNAMIKQFLRCYCWSSKDREYQVLVSEELLTEIARENRLVAAFERALRINLGESIYEAVDLPEQEIEIKSSSVVDCVLMDQPPKEPYAPKEMTFFLTENENPLAARGIEGKVFVQVHIDTEGSVIDAFVIRGVATQLDSMAVHKALHMDPWQPAITICGQKQGCKLILPFRFTIESQKINKGKG